MPRSFLLSLILLGFFMSFASEPIIVQAGTPTESDASFRSAGYDALDPKGKRAAPPVTITREDAILQTGKRTRLQSGAQDLARNYAIAAWMIRRHLDYVALFDFHSRMASSGAYSGADREALEALDDRIEYLMARDAHPKRADVARRFGRERLFRLAELRRTVDGDVGLLKLSSGHMQGIQSDLIRNPDARTQKRSAGEWVDGIEIGVGGGARRYAIHRRSTGGRGYKFERLVPANNLIHYGHFNNFATNQIRGVTPFTAALNPLRDVYEGFDYTLARMKIEQLFGLAIYREAEKSLGDVTDESDGEREGYSVDFGAGPVMLDLDPGDRAEFLQSNNPSGNAREFWQVTIGVAMKALDLPYSFYDESHTNFFGSRAAWLHYERSCIPKREDQTTAREDYTVWKLQQWVASGELILPPGMIVTDLITEWVARGMPWWDPSKEITGDKAAVSAGFDNPERITKRTGHGDVYENINATMRVMKYARDRAKEVLGDENAFALDYGNGNGSAKALNVPAAIQKIYLGVGSVITKREAREILNDQLGLSLDVDVDPASPTESNEDEDPNA